MKDGGFYSDSGRFELLLIDNLNKLWYRLTKTHFIWLLFCKQRKRRKIDNLIRDSMKPAEIEGNIPMEPEESNSIVC